MEKDLAAAFMEITGCATREDAAHHLTLCSGNLEEAVDLFFSIGAGPSGSRSPLDLAAAFMEITGCATREDAAHHLTLCSGNLEEAVDLFFSIGPGPSGSRSPPPSSQPSSSGRVSRWDSETRVVYRSGRDDGTPDGDVVGGRGRSSRRQRRRRRIRQGTCDGDNAVEGSNNSRRRGREDGISDGDREVDGNDRSRRRHINNEDGVVSGDLMLVEPPSPPPATAKKKEKVTVDGHGSSLPPLHELAYKGGFHGAVVQAARRARWLLVNVQARGEPASELQNRDVWANELVSRCVRDHFVLWQVDANAAGDEEEEAKKVCCYYRLPCHRLPAVVVVDPVTGEAMDKVLLGDAVKPKHFLMRVGPFTDTKPIMAPAIAEKPSARDDAQSNQQPTFTIAPMSSERSAGGLEPASGR